MLWRLNHAKSHRGWISGYPPSADDRLYADEIFTLELTDRQVRGFVLGKELREVVGQRERELMIRFLDGVSTGNRLTRFAALSPWSRADDPEGELQERLSALRRGFLGNEGVPPTAPKPLSLASRGRRSGRR